MEDLSGSQSPSQVEQIQPKAMKKKSSKMSKGTVEEKIKSGEFRYVPKSQAKPQEDVTMTEELKNPEEEKVN